HPKPCLRPATRVGYSLGAYADAPLCSSAPQTSMLRKLIYVFAAVALLVGLQLGANAALDAYLVRVISICGINVMLAVALNLVNGTTGQFSIGHAGFMAVGAYAGSIASFV